MTPSCIVLLKCGVRDAEPADSVPVPDSEVEEMGGGLMQQTGGRIGGLNGTGSEGSDWAPGWKTEDELLFVGGAVKEGSGYGSLCDGGAENEEKGLTQFASEGAEREEKGLKLFVAMGADIEERGLTPFAFEGGWPPLAGDVAIG